MGSHTIAADRMPLAVTSPAHQAYRLLHIAFIVAPIVAGIDKFFNALTRWDNYLAPWVTGITGLTAPSIMMIVGIIEIIAGLLVAVRPRYGAYVVFAWLWLIIINLLSYPGYFDIALRDFGLSLGALALARLSVEYDTK